MPAPLEKLTEDVDWEFIGPLHIPFTIATLSAPLIAPSLLNLAA
ncbi:MAG TPA: hypothetical protein VMI72_03670 [Roseiarcus sp.]|nr:hypothetical protein [Roseiarcus sp.]